jgi:CDP-glucose 4,6-dehydratase
MEGLSTPMFHAFYRHKRVLVTGHTGFKGSWLCEWLTRLGAEVAGYALSIPSQPAHFEEIGLADRVRDFRGDIRDYTKLLSVFEDFQPEIVFHLAAQPIVRASYDDPKTTFDTNLGGTVNLLECLRQTRSARTAVLITSDKCYENVEWEFGYRENDRLGGKDPYSASKACAEAAISAYQRSFFSSERGPRIASARAGNVIGGGDWAADRIVPDCVRSWSAERPATIRSPAATRPWQHVLEPLSGYLWLGASLAERPEGTAGEAFNFGPSADVVESVAELIGTMRETWPSAAWACETATQKPEAGLLKLNCDKALARLRWQATLSFRECVAFTADWYQSYYRRTRSPRELTGDQIARYETLARERGRAWAVPESGSAS